MTDLQKQWALAIGLSAAWFACGLMLGRLLWGQP